jgi:hypothetical protein
MRRSLLVTAAAAAALAALLACAAAATAAPRVSLMIAGPSRVLWQPHSVIAPRTSVRVGRRSCGVPRASALAALVAARRAHGPSFHVKDYGGCSGRADSGSGLFVDRIARARNRGRDGWVYKVGHRTGTAGAANPAGPFGDGHGLRSGSRVLWFWCRMGGSSCQRTLESTLSTHRVMPGGVVGVRVRGYDDRGHAMPIGGATVRLGDQTATTAADGTAQLIAPLQPGKYAVTSSREGLVPAFPEAVQVG